MDCFCIEIIYKINDLENDIHYFVITFIFMVIVMRKMWNKNIKKELYAMKQEATFDHKIT